MNLPKTYLRLFTGFFLATAVTLSAVAGAGVARAQEAGASVEIHKRSCPVDYSGNNLYEDCHPDATEGVSFELGGLRTTTNTDGNAEFLELLPGTYTVTENVPGEFGDIYVFCSFGGNPQETASFNYVAGGISLTVPENAEIICDWYNLPYNLKGSPGNGNGDGNGDTGSGSSILIHARACPTGYTGNDPYADCHDVPVQDLSFQLDGLSTTTGPNGNALFYQLNPLTFTISSAGGNFHRYTVQCSPEADISDSIPTTPVEGGVQIDVPANTAIICDWYIVPESGAGSGDGGAVTLHKSECPAGYDGSSYYEDCHGNPLADVSFDVYGPEGYLEQGVTTGSDGQLVLDGITVGGTVYIHEQLPQGTAVYVVYCSNGNGTQVPFEYQDTETVDGIRLYVSPTDNIICDWYNIPAA